MKNAGSSHLIIRTSYACKGRIRVVHFLHLVKDKQFEMVEKKGPTEQASGPQARCQHEKTTQGTHAAKKQTVVKQTISVDRSDGLSYMRSELIVLWQCAFEVADGPQNLPTPFPKLQARQNSKYHVQSRNQGPSDTPALFAVGFWCVSWP